MHNTVKHLILFKKVKFFNADYFWVPYFYKIHSIFFLSLKQLINLSKNIRNKKGKHT